MKLKKLLIVISIIILLFLIKFSGLADQLTLENLQRYKANLEQFVVNNYFIASVGYIALYIIVVAFSIPGATVMSLAGGYLFGIFPGLFYINFSAVAGATLAFLVARYLLGDFVQRKYSEKLKFLNKEIEKNGHLYLLTLRFIPIFPFFLVNILSGLTNVKLFTYIWTTAVGIFPASIAFTYAGATLEKIKSLDDIMSKELLFALILLGVFSQIPNLYKRIFKK